MSTTLGEPLARVWISQGLSAPVLQRGSQSDWPLGVEHSTLHLFGSHKQIFGVIEQDPEPGQSD